MDVEQAEFSSSLPSRLTTAPSVKKRKRSESQSRREACAAKSSAEHAGAAASRVRVASLTDQDEGSVSSPQEEDLLEEEEEEEEEEQVVQVGEQEEEEVAEEEETPCRYFTREVREHLEKHGWARIKRVLDAEATTTFKKDVERYYKLWDPKLTYDNPVAWSGTRLPAGTIHGIDKIGGHAWFMWELRQRPEIVRMWAEYFECPEEDLRVSFDGFCVYLARTPRRNAGPVGHWGHFDHGTMPKPYKCLQSIVVMEDCMGDQDGGLVVWDKSHRAHDGYFKAKGITCKSDWHLFPHAMSGGAKLRNVPQPFVQEIEADGRPYLADDDPEKDSPDPVPMERIRVGAKEGDVVIWYSDTAHQNQAPTPLGRDRIVAYVSMAPVQHILKREFATRRRAFEDRATSSHWAACGFKRNSMPRTYSTAAGHEFKRRYAAHKAAQPKLKLTEVGKRLAGLYDEPFDPKYRLKEEAVVNEEEEEEEGEKEGNEHEEQDAHESDRGMAEEEEREGEPKKDVSTKRRKVGSAKERLEKKIK